MSIGIDRNEASRHRPLAAATLTAALALSLLTPAIATAQEDGGSGSVGATVTATDWPEACILVSASEMDFGELRFSREGEVQLGGGTVDDTSEQDYAVTNCSSEEQGVMVSGTHAAGTEAAWSLVDSVPTSANVCATPDEYRLGLEVDEPEGSGSTAIFLSTGEKGLPYAGFPGMEQTRLPAGEELTMRNTIYMPCVESTGSGVTMSFDIQFLALLD